MGLTYLLETRITSLLKKKVTIKSHKNKIVNFVCNFTNGYIWMVIRRNSSNGCPDRLNRSLSRGRSVYSLSFRHVARIYLPLHWTFWSLYLSIKPLGTPRAPRKLWVPENLLKIFVYLHTHVHPDWNNLVQKGVCKTEHLKDLVQKIFFASLKLPFYTVTARYTATL